MASGLVDRYSVVALRGHRSGNVASHVCRVLSGATDIAGEGVEPTPVVVWALKLPGGPPAQWMTWTL